MDDENYPTEVQGKDGGMVWEKGNFWHVNCFFLRNSEEKLVKATYFTFIDKCSQDMAASSCVFKNDLEQFRTDFPDVHPL